MLNPKIECIVPWSRDSVESIESEFFEKLEKILEEDKNG